MELFIYSGFSELPSIDFNCLRTATYIKFNEIPVKITTNGNPYKSPNGFLPYLSDENNDLIAGYEDIITYLKSKGYGTDNTEEEFLSDSYICYLNQHLAPYREYILWGDPTNVDAVRILYAKRISFPFNFTHPQKYMKQTEDFINIFANFSINDKIAHHNTTELLIKAKIFINMLAERLGENNWFFGGQKPSEFDANIYASLAILLHMQLQNNDLKTHISECPNLVKYLKRIRTKYLLDVKVNVTDQKTGINRIKGMIVNHESGSLSNGTLKVIAGIVAIGSMIVFAITHGMVEIGTDIDDDGMHVYTPYDDDDDLGED